jgi:hypothetical protein
LLQAASLGVALGFVASTAGAEPEEQRGRRVYLEVLDCETIRVAEIGRVLEIELLARIVDRPSAEATRASVHCVGPVAGLTVVDPISEQSTSRTLTLHARSRRVHDRLIAIAIAELVGAVWSDDPVAAPAPAPSPPPPVVSPSPSTLLDPALTRRPQADARGIGVGGKTAFHFFAAPTPTWVAGGGALVSVGSGRWLAFSLDVLAETGATSLSLGRVDALVFSTRPAVGARATLGPLEWVGSAGLRAGAVVLTGTPFDPARATGGRVVGPLFAPTAEVEARLGLGRSARASVGVEGGWVTTPVQGTVNGAAGTGTERAVLGATFAITYLL